jgi:hypothetical protein
VIEDEDDSFFLISSERERERRRKGGWFLRERIFWFFLHLLVFFPMVHPGAIATFYLSLLATDQEEHENPSMEEMDEDAKLR